VSCCDRSAVAVSVVAPLVRTYMDIAGLVTSSVR
jgi:hypothetical protein